MEQIQDISSRKLSISKVNQINLETDDILGNLENPYREGSWYSKGLVVGRVQSGKLQTTLV